MSKKNNKKSEYQNENGRFKEGNPGGGRPKGSTKKNITDAIRSALAKRVDHSDPNSPTKKTQLVEKILEKAIEDGDTRVIKEIWEQLDGKPTQKTDITSNGKSVNFMVAKEIADKNLDNETTQDSEGSS